jgi:hypothetical protein
VDGKHADFTVPCTRSFSVGVLDGMTPYEYIKYLRQQFLTRSIHSVSPLLAFLLQRIEASYQYSPLEVRKPKKTTIAVVTATVRGPSIFSM